MCYTKKKNDFTSIEGVIMYKRILILSLTLGLSFIGCGSQTNIDEDKAYEQESSHTEAAAKDTKTKEVKATRRKSILMRLKTILQ